MNREKIIARIRKLMKLQKGSDFEGEIRAAVEGAQRLMEEHAIEEAELGDAAAQEEEAYGRDYSFTVGENLSRWESTLARAIANVVGTVKWYYEGHHVRKDPKTHIALKGPRHATQVVYYGPAEDVALACEMFSDISQTIVAMAVLKWGGAFRGDGLAYCCGFARELALQAYERCAARSLSLRQGISTELAVRTQSMMLAKRTKAGQWLKSEGVDLRRGSAAGVGPPTGNEDAYSEGQTDGRAHGLSVGRTPKIGAQAALPNKLTQTEGGD